MPVVVGAAIVTLVLVLLHRRHAAAFLVLALVLEISVFLSVTFVVDAAAARRAPLELDAGDVELPVGTHRGRDGPVHRDRDRDHLLYERRILESDQLDGRRTRSRTGRVRAGVPRSSPPDRRVRRCVVRLRVPGRRRGRGAHLRRPPAGIGTSSRRIQSKPNSCRTAHMSSVRRRYRGRPSGSSNDRYSAVASGRAHGLTRSGACGRSRPGGRGPARPPRCQESSAAADFARAANPVPGSIRSAASAEPSTQPRCSRQRRSRVSRASLRAPVAETARIGWVCARRMSCREPSRRSRSRASTIGDSGCRSLRSTTRRR